MKDGNYTRLDFELSRIEYRQNFKKLLAAYPNHDKYVKIEKKLNAKQIEIMRYLNMTV